MSKLAVLLVVPGVVAVGGLTAWNLSLQSDLDQLRREADERPALVERDKGPSRALKSGSLSSSRIRALEARLVDLEKVTAAPALAAVKPVEAAPSVVVPENLPDEYRSSGFTHAVNVVLDARELARRHERMEKESERLAKMALKGLEVTDTQLEEVRVAQLDYLRQRDVLRRDRSLMPDVKRDRQKELEAARDATLQGILGAELYAQLEERRSRGRRFGQNQRRTRRTPGQEQEGEREKPRRRQREGGRRAPE